MNPVIGSPLLQNGTFSRAARWNNRLSRPQPHKRNRFIPCGKTLQEFISNFKENFS